MPTQNRIERIDREIEATRERQKRKIAEIKQREQKKIDQLRAKRQLHEARARAAARKLDTRRKIVLGGALIGKVRAGDPLMRQALETLLAELPERDRALFVNWSAGN